jgi:arylsulfatase A-like enzyme
MVEALDTEIGRLLDGIEDDAPVVFLAGDNGTPEDAARPGSADQVKGSMHDGGVSPPFFVRSPHFPPREVTSLASATDVFATIAELAGYAGDVPDDSRSLVPALRGDAETGRDLVVAAFREPNGPGPYTSYRRMAFDGTHKLILDGVGPAPTVTLLGAGDAPVRLDEDVVARLTARLAELGF